MLERQDGTTLTTEDDFDVELDNVANDSRRGGRGGKPKISREGRNEKYGFGGNARKRKRDDSDVWNETGKGGRGGFGGRGRGGKKRAGPQRPGKQRRQQQRK